MGCVGVCGVRGGSGAEEIVGGCAECLALFVSVLLVVASVLGVGSHGCDVGGGG